MNSSVSVLVVDSDPRSLRAVSDLLVTAGYRVLEAATGADGLRLAYAHHPALVLLDGSLPDVDGLEVCRRIKAAPDLKGSLVLLAGLYPALDEQAQGLEAGADGYIARPISDRDLLARVKALVRTQRAEAQVRRLNAVLRAIRNVNQLIVREKDPQRLVQGACDYLIETQGYLGVWIGIADSEGKATVTAQAGLEEAFSPLDQELRRGDLPPCGQRALEHAGALVIDAPTACLGCPLAKAHSPHTSVAARLEHEGQVYGLLVVSFSDDTPVDTEERTLLTEIADDLGFALYIIEQDAARRQAEAALYEKSQELDRFFSSALDLLCIADTDGYFRRLNAEWKKTLGYTLDELEGQRFLDFVHPDDLADTLEAISSLEDGREILNFTNRYRCKDGAYRWIEWRSFPAGKSIYAAARDITEQRRTEQELRQSRKFLKDVLESIQDGISVLDSDLNILHVNWVLNEWNPERLPLEGKKCYEVYYGRSEPCDPCPTLRSMRSRKTESERVSEWAEVFSYPMIDQETGQVTGVVEFIRDISERVRAEAELAAQNARLEALYRAGQMLNATLDPDVILDYLTDEAMRVTTATHGQALVVRQDLNIFERRSLRGFSPQEEEKACALPLPLTRGINARVYLSGEVVCVDDVRSDPEYFPLIPSTRSELAIPVVYEGQVVGNLDLQSPEVGAFRQADVVYLRALADQGAVALKNAHLLAQVSEQARRVQRIMDTVPEGVLLLDGEQRVVLVNPVAERDLPMLTGDKESEPLTHLGDRPLTELLTSPPKGLWHEVEVGARTFEVIARPIENGPEPERWVLVISDATQARVVRRQLEQQERLATVGQLAAGIAHDFNNILASITLYAHLSLRSPDLSPELGERMQVILGEASSAANLVQQILDFSRRAAIERKPLALTSFLKEIVKLLQRTLPENIQVGLVCDTADGTIHADPTRVQQVLVNLAVNARDAMPDGGALHVTLRRVERGERFGCVTCGPLMGGDWVEVAVTDTGNGIPPEVLPRIFEPFFTTRAPLGHGLGLAQVYGIVKQHEGHLDVKTELGTGTKFHLYWPALPTAEAVCREMPLSLSIGHSETILVVEDDDVLRAALTDVLTALNYTVLAAVNGQDALKILESRQDEIALVLSDWVMPVMGGLVLAQEMQASFPQIQMLMLTGHPLSEEVRAAAPASVIGWVQKPLDLERLSGAVARALGREV